MNDALVVSNLLLWLAVLALLVVVLALARQIGILHERIAPMGALMMDAGPKAGEPAPRFDLATLDGGLLRIGASGERSTMLFFLSPTCPVCKKLLPVLKSIARAEAGWLDVAFASDGHEAEHEAFRRRADIGGIPYVLSAELGMRFRVAKLPYAVLIDEAGRVRAKGLVNSREQLDSLFTAREVGAASVQDFLARTADLAKERA